MPDIPDTPYLSGLLLGISNEGFIVRNVLSGTAAGGAGILPGEMIVAVDGKVANAELDLIRRAEGSDSREVHSLLVRDAFGERVVTLTYRSITEILDKLAVGQMEKTVEEEMGL